MSSSYEKEIVKGSRCKKKKKMGGVSCFSLISAAHGHGDVFLLQMLCSSIEIIQQPTCMIFCCRSYRISASGSIVSDVKSSIRT